MTKVCVTCRVEKSVNDFYRDVLKSDGRVSACKECRSSYHRKWRGENPDKARKGPTAYYLRNRDRILAEGKRARAENPREYREERLRYLYGIGVDDYDRMLANQGGRCAICRGSDPHTPGGKTFVVDHDHFTRAVRGLLCATCNRALGLMRDDVGIVERAFRYLEASAKAHRGRDAA